MTAQRYQAIFDWFRARPAALRALGYAQKISVLGVYLVYGAVLAVTLWQRSGQFWRVLAVPAAVYVLGTLLRAAINRPRPYEALNFTPLFPKDTKGQSMRSRHCFSAAAIVAAAFTVWVPLGVAACLLAAVIFLRWETAYRRHPERFLECGNDALRCKNCQEQLCRYKRSLSAALRPKQ